MLASQPDSGISPGGEVGRDTRVEGGRMGEIAPCGGVGIETQRSGGGGGWKLMPAHAG